MAKICVAGAINVDIVAVSNAAIVFRDSNPGTIRMALGGVGRNIAENLARLGNDVSMLSAYGYDNNAQMIIDGCKQVGIDLSHALVDSLGSTSTYVALHDERGEMQLAISDMDICKHLTPDYFAQHLDTLNRADAVVLEANLPEDSLNYLGAHVTAPLFADCVSVAKVERLRGILPKLTALKCNRDEAELLSGMPILLPRDAIDVAKALLDFGISCVLISLGTHGAYYATQTDSGLLPIIDNIPMRCTTGCGDAFFGAAIHQYLQGANVRSMVHYGLLSAAFCGQSESAVNPQLSERALQKFAPLHPQN